MRQFHIAGIAFLIVSALFFSACGSSDISAPTPTDAAVAAATDTPTPPDPTATAEPEVAPTEAPASSESTATAVPEEEMNTTEMAEEVDFEKLEAYDEATFSDPTTIDNQWLPLIPGNRWILEGDTDEDGERVPHRVIFTVTDLTKVIDGVRTVVVWDQDYADGELVEAEIALFAQDDNGNVWHFGQYPEEYEAGELVAAPAWIHGFEDAQAGISMKAEPDPDAPSYSQGWGPAVDWTDRAVVFAVDQETCVPAGCYENVLIMDEFARGEPNAFQQKYYAPSVGNVRVGWRGEDATQEELEMVEFLQLDEEAMAEARASALALEASANENSSEIFGQTDPIEAP